MKNINPTQTQSWKELQKHFHSIKNLHMKDLFEQDPHRFNNFSLTFENKILIDFSKNRITYDTLRYLFNLAKDCNLQHAISSMFRGEKINRTENRAVLHVALRNRTNQSILVDGKNVMPIVNTNLEKMKNFCEKVINGEWKGYNKDNITDIVNIGIGGSHLGPYMVTEALRPYKNHLNIHFISNIDATHLTETLKKIQPETTLFLIASKTFTTQETMQNAYSVKDWFLKITKYEKYIAKHFIAISSNIEAILNFGISSNNIFECWDWVGGRFSLWSSVGLSIALSLGFENFEKLLEGAHSMDHIFKNNPIDQNIPIILALIGIWYNNFFETETESILPYDQYMYLLPTYLQQSNMESNGKNIDRHGNPVEYQTGPIIWGGTGTSAQHAFYQLLHQGTKIVPCDFIATAISHNPLLEHHNKLLANCFAQTEALAFGQKMEKDIGNGIRSDIDEDERDRRKYVSSFKRFAGNRPSNTILIKKITPYTLGALIALYEHKIFTQGVILNIHAFDQWGVELGKILAEKIIDELNDNHRIYSHDSSTNGLINCYKNWRIN
ncbi:glucose-6-phosphate isomerase [Candidatus Schneideria nysicola]|uniref:glucose-6-phosphate isomerase n=1 Tax=Candidatus Schneideria nysicola TaxID=1081631 RepID=UPI001CAA48F9|nr:glucose-6-phosphate isomerase [Candidatus Schneideria nysicola]UAJ65193.1 glucose-6-phosphate isomerase [Candidatus Schneideria nysicola]